MLKENLLFRKFESQEGTSSKLQCVVLEKLQKEVLDDLHGGELSGRLGEDNTFSHIKKRTFTGLATGMM